MKIKTTMKDITSRFNKVYRCGYCELQNIMLYTDPIYYNCGVYGWNCDVYIDYKNDIAITTGYRNMRGESIPKDLIEKYDIIAKDIVNRKHDSFEDMMNALTENMENFYNELAELN